MKFRPHRGLLTDSMAACVDVADSAALIAYLQSQDPDSELNYTQIQIEPYGNGTDARVGWTNLCIVTLDGYGVLGFVGNTAPVEVIEATNTLILTNDELVILEILCRIGTQVINGQAQMAVRWVNLAPPVIRELYTQAGPSLGAKINALVPKTAAHVEVIDAEKQPSRIILLP